MSLRNPQESDRVIFSNPTIEAAEELALRGIAYAHKHLPQLQDTDPELAANVLSLIRQGIINTHIIPKAEPFWWEKLGIGKKQRLRRISALISAEKLALNPSNYSSLRWRVSNANEFEVSSISLIAGSSPKEIYEFEEMEITIGSTKFKTGIRIADSIERNTQGTTLPLFLIEMGRGNFQGVIGNSPQGIYNIQNLTPPNRPMDNWVKLESMTNTLKPGFFMKSAWLGNKP